MSHFWEDTDGNWWLKVFGKARNLKEASTHWLRHTGASMEVERGHALQDLSEDLGHASMATTDTVYVQTENRVRAESCKFRKVN